jgi:ubiquinone/menaquinone biosynthesis C-methylase UbiE
MDGKPIGAGKSSFELLDKDLFLAEVAIDRGVVVDIGCGKGDYALPLAERIGLRGLVYGVDLWEEGIDLLRQRAAERGLGNVRAIVADVARGIPLDDHTADLCLMATVLHDFLRIGAAETALRETARLLKPGGLFQILEFKKIEGPPGPPIHVRLAPAEVERMIESYGFKMDRVVEMGD